MTSANGHAPKLSTIGTQKRTNGNVMSEAVNAMVNMMPQAS